MEATAEDRSALLQWLSTVTWDTYVTDATVYEHLKKVQTRVNEINAPKDVEKKAKTETLASAKRVKLVVVGDGAVGKTSLLIRYATGEFPTDYLPTVFENYTAQMKRDDELILLHLWDTAGQEDYDRLRPLSYPNSDVLLLCFSTIGRASFEAIKDKWAPEVRHHVPNVPIILVGTKMDLREAKFPDPNTGSFDPITTEQGQALARDIGAVKYMEVSSKDARGVNEVFAEGVNLVFEQREEATNPKPDSNTKKPAGKKKNGNCLVM